MKKTSKIGMIVAVGAAWLSAVAAPAAVVAADGTRPTYKGYQPKSTAGPNDNDYHADYHADHSVAQDPRQGASQIVDERPDPREDARRFQDGDRYLRPYGWRR